MKNKIIIFSVLILGILIGLGISYAGTAYLKLKSPTGTPYISNKENHLGGYKFINPLLSCEYGDQISEALIPFKDKLENLVRGQLVRNDAKHVSIYFRDLNNGPWFGIGENDPFIPASLVKVPIMIAAYKLAETNPDFLKKTVLIEKVSDQYTQYFKPKEKIQFGQTYTLEELIERMIIYSDNDAKDLVVKSLDNRDIIDEVFNLLGGDFATEDFDITVRSYASFFRILFNASYLSKDMSEKALELLVKTNFDPGIAGGVPNNISVADKFGEKVPTTNSEEKQLHNCGIVYYPKHPYLICIMTRGDDFDRLAGVIKSISSFVYQEVDKQYSN